MVIQAVLFDLGETLFNYGDIDVGKMFAQGARLTYDYLCQNGGADGQLPDFVSYYRSHIFSIKWHCLWSNVKRREFDCLALLDRKARSMGFQLEKEQLEELAWLWYQPLGGAASIEQDLEEHLQRLLDMSLELAIISNTFLPSHVLDRHLQKFGLLRFFPTRIYSSETLFRKPDRRIYRIALNRLNAEASATLMVGDKLREDINGPARLGITGVFKRGHNNRTKRVSPHIPVINSIGELPDLIHSMNG